ncbi:hypothetical protein [Maridesulfovibrio sp.]|uniref:hypothetical protein n=1 Tax=Maridesulfovibrio sp. TaxID=2795000 RepID=UPI0029C9CD6F|nr:hypothetical protein [Maridesulfovibrio sp.]
MPPALLHLASEAEYKAHFEEKYCAGPLITFDGIPVYFSKTKFSHAFFECTRRDGNKNAFSSARAQRMDWIETALKDSTANRYQGWDGKKRQYDPTRRVAVVIQDFVVVIRIKAKRDGSLKAEFITCYKADNSIEKICRSPAWDEQTCRAALGV